MVNIGTRPTVDGPHAVPSIEAHIIDFEGDIYGKDITLDFYHRLRDEIRFSSTDELASQLEKDRDSTRQFSIPR